MPSGRELVIKWPVVDQNECWIGVGVVLVVWPTCRLPGRVHHRRCHVVAFGRFTWCRVKALCCDIRSIDITLGEMHHVVALGRFTWCRVKALCCGIRPIGIMLGEMHHVVAFGRFTWCRVKALCCGFRPIGITLDNAWGEASCCGIRPIHMMLSERLKILFH